jgi:hypothetical protein
LPEHRPAATSVDVTRIRRKLIIDAQQESTAPKRNRIVGERASPASSRYFRFREANGRFAS